MGSSYHGGTCHLWRAFRRGLNTIDLAFAAINGLNSVSQQSYLPFTLSIPDFSIVTPSFRSSKWLKRCIPSIADQEGVTLEHIVQDSCSDDGTGDWLPSDTRVKSFFEKDSGMYDAVNRGWKRCTGVILAYLNCDEQYLPGALKAVKEYFDAHPKVDIVFGDVIVTDANGAYKCHRKVVTPTLYHTQTCSLTTLTCAMFIRRKLIVERDYYFDPKLRDVGDGAWMTRALSDGVQTGVVRKFISVFTDTGANMSVGENAKQERLARRKTVSPLIQFAQPLWLWLHRLRRLLNGAYFQQPFSYEIYTENSLQKRVKFEVKKPTGVWRL